MAHAGCASGLGHGRRRTEAEGVDAGCSIPGAASCAGGGLRSGAIKAGVQRPWGQGALKRCCSERVVAFASCQAKTAAFITGGAGKRSRHLSEVSCFTNNDK